MTNYILNPTDNRKIAISESRKDGMPILLLHGNSLSARLYKKQIKSELGNKYRLIAFDFPGCGMSQKAANPKKTYSVKGLIQCLLSVIEQLDLEDLILVGHSLGGHLIVEAASQIPSAQGFVVFGTPFFGIPPAMDKAFLPHPHLGLASQSDLSTGKILALAQAFVKKETVCPSAIMNQIAQTDTDFRSCLAQSIGKGEMKDELKIAAKLQKPIAIFHGEGDQLVNREYLQSLTIPSLWRNEVQVIPDAGHTPQWENAKVFNVLLEEFIKERHSQLSQQINCLRNEQQ